MAQNYWQSQPRQQPQSNAFRPDRIQMSPPPPQAVQRGLYAAQYRSPQRQIQQGVSAHPPPVQPQAQQRQQFRPAVQAMPTYWPQQGAQQNAQVASPFLELVRRLWGM